MNWPLLQNSLLLALLTTVLATLLGSVAAVFAATISSRWRVLLLGAALAVFALPPFLVTNTWLHYFGLTGVWRTVVDFNIYSFSGTVLVLTLQLWPIPFVFLLSRLIQVEKTYFEQEPILGGLALWRHLLWPFCRSAILNAAVLVFVLALNNFAVPALLQTKVYPAEVWLGFNTRFDYLEVVRLSWPLVIAPLLLILYFQARPIRFSHRSTLFSARLLRERAGVPAILLSALAAGALLLFSLFLPITQLLASERMWTEFLPAFAAGQNAFLNSFLFALLSALTVFGAGLLLRRFRWPAVAWVPLLAPGLLLGVSLIFLFNRPWLSAIYQGIGIVVIAYALRFLALGWAGARLARAQSDRTLIDAARSLGAHSWRQFLLAEWPQSGKYLLGVAYLVYLLCLWDVETLIFIVPPGRETLALRIFNMLHYGHATQVDALCVWLLVLALTPLLLWGFWRMVRSKWRFAPALLAAAPLFTGCGSGASPALQSDLFNAVEMVGTRGTGPGHFNKPRSLALDEEDNLYVVDLTGRVQKFSPEGKFLLAWQMPQTDKGKPKGMIGDPRGGVIVIEPHYSRVNHFTPSGQLAFQWGDYGTNAGLLTFPRSAAINSEGEIYVTEYGMIERVQRFTARGKEFLGAFGQRGTAPGDFNRPEGLGIDAHDQLYVADSCNHRVQVFSREGRFITSFGKAGSGPGEMSYPYDVRIDSAGNIFVCEFGNSRIQIFDSAHHSIGFLGGSGLEPGQLNNPWSIALDSRGNLFVADSGNHRVQKFIRKDPLPSSKSIELTLAK